MTQIKRENLQMKGKNLLKTRTNVQNRFLYYISEQITSTLAL